MGPNTKRALLSLGGLGLLATVVAAAPQAQASGWGIRPGASFSRTIERVTAMPQDRELQTRARSLGLGVVNVMWEDTGRSPGSALGPNISDVTLQVREPLANGGTRTHLLPVIRHPNFTDKTADIPAEDMWVRVGNHRSSRGLEAVPLREVLGNLKAYLSDPDSLLGDGDFTAERDSHFLVSAQHVFVPLPKRGQAEFNPVIFNYQSAPGSPAVLTLLVTREGTSATVIENSRGDQSYQGWGQQLFFNESGERATFTAERKSAVKARIAQGEGTAADEGALEEGADMMMIVQVPLKHRNVGFLGGLGGSMADVPAAAAEGAPMARARRSRGASNVEQAVLGHGQAEGPFREMGGLELERDPRFPVRVTVQFYRATSNGVISAADLRAVKRQIDEVYENGDFVGSLVVPDGERTRPTDWLRTRRRMQL
jgi:hypothetical protein